MTKEAVVAKAKDEGDFEGCRGRINLAFIISNCEVLLQAMRQGDMRKGSVRRK